MMSCGVKERIILRGKLLECLVPNLSRYQNDSPRENAQMRYYRADGTMSRNSADEVTWVLLYPLFLMDATREMGSWEES